MPEYAYSLSVIVPAEHANTARRMLWALGHDNVNLTSFSSRLSSDGSEPVTHYGLHSYVDQAFVDMLNAADQGVLPGIVWADYSLDNQAVLDTVAMFTTVYVEGGLASNTWPAAMKQAGVQPVYESDNDEVIGQ